MYTLEQLQSKTLGELKKIGDELNVLPEGDRRCRQNWIDAIAGVNPPLLQLLEVSPAASVVKQVQPIIETVEASPVAEDVQAQEPPIESKFGRIVYPRHQKPHENQTDKTDTDRVGAGSAQSHNLRNIDTTDSLASSKNFKTGANKRQICDQLLATPGDSERYRREALLHQSVELVIKTSPGVEVEPVSEPILPVAENSPGVEVDRVQEPIEVQSQEPYPRNARRDCPRCVGIQSLYWTRNFCMEEWVIRCLYCDYERPKYPRFAHLEPPVYGPEEYPTRKEAICQASAFQAPPPSYSKPGDCCCTWAPIAVPPTEPPPGVKTEPKVSQSAIALWPKFPSMLNPIRIRS